MKCSPTAQSIFHAAQLLPTPIARATYVDTLGSHDGRVATGGQHGHVSPWGRTRCEPGMSTVEGAGGTCRRGVCRPERVIGERGGGDGG